jgi:hypothetical protein
MKLQMPAVSVATSGEQSLHHSASFTLERRRDSSDQTRGSANDCDQVSAWQTALFCLWWFIYTHTWEENLALPDLQTPINCYSEIYLQLDPWISGQTDIVSFSVYHGLSLTIRVKGYYIQGQNFHVAKNSCNCHVIGPEMSQNMV